MVLVFSWAWLHVFSVLCLALCGISHDSDNQGPGSSLLCCQSRFWGTEGIGVLNTLIPETSLQSLYKALPTRYSDCSREEKGPQKKKPIYPNPKP